MVTRLLQAFRRKAPTLAYDERTSEKFDSLIRRPGERFAEPTKRAEKRHDRPMRT